MVGGWERKDNMSYQDTDKAITKERIIRMLKAEHECLTRQTRGNFKECNKDLCESCDLCYEQGTYGDKKLMIETLLWALDCGVIG